MEKRTVRTRGLSGRQARKETSRKSRLTLSLEWGTVEFLQRCQAESSAASMSACVESIIAERRRQLESEELSAQMIAYYDAVSGEEQAENDAWGRLSEGEFLSVER